MVFSIIIDFSKSIEQKRGWSRQSEPRLQAISTKACGEKWAEAKVPRRRPGNDEIVSSMTSEEWNWASDQLTHNRLHRKPRHRRLSDSAQQSCTIDRRARPARSSSSSKPRKRLNSADVSESPEGGWSPRYRGSGVATWLYPCIIVLRIALLTAARRRRKLTLTHSNERQSKTNSEKHNCVCALYLAN